MPTIRKNLENLVGNNFDLPNTNASLWLDKFINESWKDGKSFDQKETAKAEIVREVTQKIIEPPIYNDYFHKVWKLNLDSFGAKYREAKVKNRLAINLGSESVLETNIALHRVFGVPFIAGSSLKGMTAAFIRQYGDWKKDGDFYITVFGDENNAGFITFYDALYIPETGFNKKPLYSDVMTTHHQDYYGEKKENNQMLPPADWDGPIPVPFISATGEYLIALSAPEGCEAWIELTFDILGFALATEGIGAKTSSGYGRMWLKDETGETGKYSDKYEIKASVKINPIANKVDLISSGTQVITENDGLAASLIQQINALRNTDVASQIRNFADQCFALQDESAQKKVAQTIKQKVIDTNREKASRETPWYQHIVAIGEGHEWVVEVKQ